jgi:hypothetical protein
MEGVWIDPVTAHEMMILRDFAMSSPPYLLSRPGSLDRVIEQRFISG